MLEALLGGLQSLGTGISSTIQQSEAAKAKAASDRNKFQGEILKGLILQSLKKNGKPISFGEDLVTGENPYIDPSFIALLKKMGIGKGSMGGGTKRRSLSPPGATAPIFPVGGTPPTGGPKRITISR